MPTRTWTVLACVRCLQMVQPNPQSKFHFDVRGRVLDGETGEPLQDVNVFFANTMIGAATDENGDFVIVNVPEGVYELIVSRLGYEVKTMKLEVYETQRKKLLFKLDPRAIKLPAVEVSAEELKRWDTESTSHYWSSVRAALASGTLGIRSLKNSRQKTARKKRNGAAIALKLTLCLADISSELYARTA